MKHCMIFAHRVVALVCVFLQVFLIFGTTAFAVSNESVDASESEQVEVSSSEIDGITEYSLNNSTEETSTDLLYAIETPFDLNPNIIRITFDATDIVDYSFEAEGLTVVESEETPMVFDITANEEFGKFEVEAEKNNGDILHKTLYTYTSGTEIFTSELSKDTAWFNCKQQQFDNGLLTMEDWHAQYSELSLEFTEAETDSDFMNMVEANNSISVGYTVVGGRMTWETENGTVLPLRCTKVEVGYNLAGPAFFPLATTYTDDNGYYNFGAIQSGFGSNNVFVRVYIESDTIKVLQPYLEAFNYYLYPVSSFQSGGAIEISRRMKGNIGWLRYKMLYVQQGMVLGERFATEMGMETDEKLYVFYLGNIVGVEEINDNAFCYDKIAFIGDNDYNNFSTTIHEYGHFVENRMGNYGDAVKGHLFADLPDDFAGIFSDLSDFIEQAKQNIADYEHDGDENNFDKGIDKDFEMELTWSEAWAYAFAEIAMQRYSSGYGGAYNLTTPERHTLVDTSGEAQEDAVIAFLWDLYDFYSTAEPNDNISMTAQEWWDLTTEAETYKLQDLTENIIENYPELIDDVGEILGNHQISPQIISVLASPCTGSQLRLKWKVNGAASSPNDLFRVFFYDEDNNMIARGDPISCALAYSAEFVYTVPSDLWNEVQDSFAEGKTIFAVVYGYRSGEFTSGPYFSEYIEVWDSSYGHVYNTGFDEHTHWLYCSCGYGNSGEAHDLTYMSTQVPLPTHSESCDCGYIGIVNHDYYEYTQVGTDYHKGKCVCGNPCPTEEHSEEYIYKSAASHYVQCICGKIRTEAHTIVTQGVRSYCTGCRHLFLEPGATNSVEDPIESLTE